MKRKFRENHFLLLLAYLGLVAFVLTLQLSLHFLPDVIAEHAKGLNLQGDWNFCWANGSKSSPEGCQWQQVTFPGTVSKGKATASSVLYLEKSFGRPDICDGRDAFCTLFIGTMSDPAAVYVNDKLAGQVGNPGVKKSYTQTFPTNITISPDLLRDHNRLLIRIHPNYLGNQGLIRGPIHLFSFETASWVSRIVIAQTIALPMISGVILLLIFFVTLLICASSRVWDLKVQSFLGYCFTMGLYLISLTRLPREVLPPQLGIGLHFALRVITEYFHFGLVTSLFEKRIRWVSCARYYSLGLFFLLLIPVISPFGGVELNSVGEVGRWLYRWNVALFVIPPLLSIFFIYSMDSGHRKAYLPLGALYVIVCGMIISDCLAINGIIEDIYFVRFYPLLVALGYCSALWLSYSQHREKRQLNAALGELSAQVAHDIRSPLLALNVVSEDLRQLSQRDRLLLRGAVERINDIANGLLKAHRWSAEEPLPPEVPVSTSVHWIWGLISSLVSEKRLQLRARPEVHIGFSSQVSCAAFARINGGEFKRVLSNLINNSVEALSVSGGNVEVSLAEVGNNLTVCIADDGVGIPREVLSRIQEEAFSYNKPSGFGLGLNHARETIRSWKGALTIESERPGGTKVRISLPRSKPPSWWTSKLTVRTDARLVIVDDDRSMPQIWTKRLNSESPAGAVPEVVYFGSIRQFRAWWQANGNSDDLVLIDYEFADERENGVEVVEQLQIAGRAILITSRYEQRDILEACERMALRMIPKAYIGSIPICFEGAFHGSESSKRDLGRIDSDSLV